jgi:hypothetical protein
MHMRSDTRGIAFVEILIGLLVAAIVVGAAIMLLEPPDRAAAVKACQSEAHTFDQAVSVYHFRHGGRAWPDTNAHGSVQAVSIALELGGGLGAKDPLAHLDGLQRVPPTGAHGWTYDFERHATNASGCSR